MGSTSFFSFLTFSLFFCLIASRLSTVLRLAESTFKKAA
jgi:hypothetical protein